MWLICGSIRRLSNPPHLTFARPRANNWMQCCFYIFLNDICQFIYAIKHKQNLALDNHDISWLLYLSCNHRQDTFTLKVVDQFNRYSIFLSVHSGVNWITLVQFKSSHYHTLVCLSSLHHLYYEAIINPMILIRL